MASMNGTPADRNGDVGDEELVAIFFEWWDQTPIPENEGSAAVIEDVQSLLAHLDAKGFKLVRK